jgi:hypothetical protein
LTDDSDDASEFDGDTLPSGNAFATAIGGGAGTLLCLICCLTFEMNAMCVSADDDAWCDDKGDDGGGGARMRLERLAAQFAEALRAAAVRAGAGRLSLRLSFRDCLLTLLRLQALCWCWMASICWPTTTAL